MNATEPNKLSPNACPPGCVEHYTAGPGGRWHNHSTAPRYVTGDSATDDDQVVSLGVWLEVREHLDGAEPVDVVGIVHQDGPGQAELSSAQLRQFALHVLAVAGQVDQVTSERQLPVRVSAVSENTGLLPMELRTSAIGGRRVHLHAGMEDLMLEPCDARQLGEALIRMAG